MVLKSEILKIRNSEASWKKRAKSAEAELELLSGGLGMLEGDLTDLIAYGESRNSQPTIRKAVEASVGEKMAMRGDLAAAHMP